MDPHGIHVDALGVALGSHRKALGAFQALG
nr:MAG TPA: hypothetical protein [Caudoviricetes sp.]